MTIELTNEQRQFIQQEIASGHYTSEEALLNDAFDLLRQRQKWIEKVQIGAQQGRDDIAAGRYFEVNSSEDAKKLREEISRRVAARRAQREQTSP